MKWLFDFLRSPAGILMFLLGALGAQVPHAATVFHRIAHDRAGSVSVLAYVYAVALEGLILLFVLNGWRVAAWGFAVVSVAINVCYYYPTLDTVAKLLISVALPAAIALDSELVERTLSRSKQEASEAEAKALPYQCDKCGRKFRSQNAMNAHKCNPNPQNQEHEKSE